MPSLLKTIMAQEFSRARVTSTEDMDSLKSGESGAGSNEQGGAVLPARICEQLAVAPLVDYWAGYDRAQSEANFIVVEANTLASGMMAGQITVQHDARVLGSRGLSRGPGGVMTEPEESALVGIVWPEEFISVAPRRSRGQLHGRCASLTLTFSFADRAGYLRYRPRRGRG